MTLTPLFEVTYSDAPQVDSDAGVIRGVKILGRTSRNGREYSDAALHQAARFYEGLGVNLNHRGQERTGGERTVEEGLGWLQNIEVRPEGVFGNLHYFRSHQHANLLVEAAQRNPKRFGLSHHAEGRVERRDGRLVVESIESVRSVDVVQNPATSSGLFESAEESSVATVKDVLAAGPATLAELVEDQVIAAFAETAEFVGENCEDDDRLASAVQSLALNLLEDEQLALQTRLRQAYRVLNAHHELGRPQPPALSEAASLLQTGAAGHSGPATLEQLLERIERLETQARCRTLLETAGRAPTPARLEALAALDSDDDRQELIESWPDRDVVRPARMRPSTSPPLHADRDEPLRFPTTTREFVAALR